MNYIVLLFILLHRVLFLLHREPSPYMNYIVLLYELHRITSWTVTMYELHRITFYSRGPPLLKEANWKTWNQLRINTKEKPIAAYSSRSTRRTAQCAQTRNQAILGFGLCLSGMWKNCLFHPHSTSISKHIQAFISKNIRRRLNL